MLRVMKVLIATDGHEAATHAIASALQLLPLDRAEVRVVSVLDPEERIGANDDAEDDLDHAQAQLAAGGVTASRVQRRGHFADEIVAEANEWGPDVLVMGSSSRGRIARWLAGSVSDAVIHQWRGPVLLVPSV